MARATSTRTEPETLQARLRAGVAGGLAGGLVFGALMHTMGMMPMVAMLIGSQSIAVGWIGHLAISVFVGGTFALVTAGKPLSRGGSALAGTGYGALWWVLGPLLIMPARLGMKLLAVSSMTMQSLAGHLMYGLVLGLVFAAVGRRPARA
ncbi:MAG: hypothetical protein ACRDJ4_12420 [Actinomycetota bacterium]